MRMTDDLFEELTIPHMAVLYKMAYHLAGSREDAEDLVQEVFFRARKSFHMLKDQKKVKSWMCSILYRHFVDEYRLTRKYVPLDESLLRHEEAEELDWPERFTSADIAAALSRLEPRFRLPLVAFFMSGRSYLEIAESLDVPIGTVMSRIHRAKNMMRRELENLAGPNLRIVNGGRNDM